MEGHIRFGSLAHYMSIEDEARRDENEGASLFSHGDGLLINNISQNVSGNLEGYTFVSQVKTGEIFISCFSRALNPELWNKFSALFCVEITKIGIFIEKIRVSLPSDSTVYFRRVQYYDRDDNPTPRWAVPEVIASSKLNLYSQEEESRLLFSTTDALRFENVDLCLRHKSVQHSPIKPASPFFNLNIGDIQHICTLHQR